MIHSLMNWLSSFAITVLGIDAPTPAKKSAQLAGNLPAETRQVIQQPPKTKKTEQSCVPKQWKWPLNYSNSCFALSLLLLFFMFFIYLHQVLVMVCGISPILEECRIFQLQHRSSSLNRREPGLPASRKVRSLGHWTTQEVPALCA